MEQQDTCKKKKKEPSTKAELKEKILQQNTKIKTLQQTEGERLQK